VRTAGLDKPPPPPRPRVRPRTCEYINWELVAHFALVNVHCRIALTLSCTQGSDHRRRPPKRAFPVTAAAKLSSPTPPLRNPLLSCEALPPLAPSPAELQVSAANTRATGMWGRRLRNCLQRCPPLCCLFRFFRCPSSGAAEVIWLIYDGGCVFGYHRTPKDSESPHCSTASPPPLPTPDPISFRCPSSNYCSRHGPRCGFVRGG